MNRTNIQATIDILKQAQNFNIESFQSREGIATTIEELHTCGNTACIAGYVALSPHFHAQGGQCTYGMPFFPDLTSAELGAADGDEQGATMARYWGLPEDYVMPVVFGFGWSPFVYRMKLQGMPCYWRHMTKENAISLFEQLLAKGQEANQPQP